MCCKCLCQFGLVYVDKSLDILAWSLFNEEYQKCD